MTRCSRQKPSPERAAEEDTPRGGKPSGERQQRIPQEGLEEKGERDGSPSTCCGLMLIDSRVGQGGCLSHESNNLRYTGRGDGVHEGRGWHLHFYSVYRQTERSEGRGGQFAPRSKSKRCLRAASTVALMKGVRIEHARLCSCSHSNMRSAMFGLP